MQNLQEVDQLEIPARKWRPVRYSPDLKQRRVRDRIETNLDRFLFAYRGKEMQLHRDSLEETFGSHGNKMFGWLRARLLTNVRGHSVEASRSTTYTVNQDGFDDLWRLIHKEAFNYAEQRAKQLAPVLQPYFDGSVPLPLHNTTEGGRLYGPHLQMERDVKAILMQGCWDYDIQAAMPTLVLQSIPDWEQKFRLWRKYLGDRQYFRAKLMSDQRCSAEQAKQVFQFLFSGATFNGSRHGVGSVFTPQQTKAAMNDPWLWGLYQEARAAWSEVGCASSRGPDRFKHYEQLEQQVMRAVYGHLESKSVRYWPFHDGFTLLDDKTSTAELRQTVLDETGYSVIFDEKQL